MVRRRNAAKSMGWRTGTCGARPVAGRRPASGLWTEPPLPPAELQDAGRCPLVLVAQFALCAFQPDRPHFLPPSWQRSPKVGAHTSALAQEKGVTNVWTSGSVALEGRNNCPSSHRATQVERHFGPGIVGLFFVMVVKPVAGSIIRTCEDLGLLSVLFGNKLSFFFFPYNTFPFPSLPWSISQDLRQERASNILFGISCVKLLRV